MKDFQTLLFLCTGNFYRSRFAEAVFNHCATKAGLEWRALSRGFRPHLATEDLSHFVTERLGDLSIPSRLTQATPTKIDQSDLAEASLVIALYEPEHRPMLAKAFAPWENRVHYWQIPDIDVESPAVALPKIEAEVESLVRNLRRGHALGVRGDSLVEF